MLTPVFKLSQDENHVFITVHAPYTNIGETEIDVDGDIFLFVSSPYFLRLRLPGRIIENDQSKGSYECDSGDFNLTFDKETPGEMFENLDMISSMLPSRNIPDVNPNLVEMLEDDGISIEEDEEDDEPIDRFTYGFANKITTNFCDIGREFKQIFELRAPERVAVPERHNLRIQYENRKFSSDHYLADLYDDELLAPYQDRVAPWNAPDFTGTEFTDDEIRILKELHNKHYILTRKEYKEVFFSLVDILFGYCYDKRTTLDDSSVESSWTINKLSPTLTWFCTFKDLKEVIIASYRRALCFPIFRNFELCNKVKSDLVSLLNKGKKYTIKCIIHIYSLFNSSNDARYILNQLYIKDYLIFLQKCKEEEFQELAKNISEIELKKGDLGLELDELEEAASLVEMEQAEIVENEMALKMADMSLIPGLKHQQKQNVDEDDEDDDEDDDDSDDDGVDDDDNDDEDDNDGDWITSSSVSSDSSSDDSSSDSSSDELDSDDDPS